MIRINTTCHLILGLFYKNNISGGKTDIKLLGIVQYFGTDALIFFPTLEKAIVKAMNEVATHPYPVTIP